MRAACRFARELGVRGVLDRGARVAVELYGSLALTGHGHATDRAVLLGLAGNEPAAIDPAAIESTVAAIRTAQRIELAGVRSIAFEESRDLLFHRAVMFPPGAEMQHPNGLRLKAFDAAGAVVDERTFFSIGGGFITEDGAAGPAGKPLFAEKPQATIPFPFHNAAELPATAEANELSISQLMLENECALAARDAERAPVEVVRQGIERIWKTMQVCVERGIAAESILPGGLNVRRRAHRLAARLGVKERADATCHK
jgi:L-serine dehydratase